MLEKHQLSHIAIAFISFYFFFLNILFFIFLHHILCFEPLLLSSPLYVKKWFKENVDGNGSAGGAEEFKAGGKEWKESHTLAVVSLGQPGGRECEGTTMKPLKYINSIAHSHVEMDT